MARLSRAKREQLSECLLEQKLLLLQLKPFTMKALALRFGVSIQRLYAFKDEVEKIQFNSRRSGVG